MTRLSNNQLVAAAFSHARSSGSGWYRASCPLCLINLGKTDARQSLGILVGVWKWHCFRCGASGRLPGAPTGLETVDIPAEVEQVDPAKLQAPDGFTLLADGDGAEALSFADARMFLQKRGVSRQTCRAIGIGATLKGNAAYRVIVPVKCGDEWFGWVGRSWVDKSPLRYLYPRGMPRARLFFNGDALRVETDEPAVIVEGVFDALPHYPHAVACLGKPSHEHLPILLNARRPIVVMLDGDAHEEALTLALQMQVQYSREVYFAKLPPLTDPGDLNSEEFNLRVSAAMGYKDTSIQTG